MPFKNSPLAIYLDQNKWIDLARAYHGLPNGQKYQEVLTKIISHVKQGKIVLPLSYTHFLETRKSKDLERRERLATVMAELSQGVTISLQSWMTKFELRKAIAKTFEKGVFEVPEPFGYGIPFAFGMSLGLTKTTDYKEDKTIEEYNNLLPALMASVDIVKMFLNGDDEDENLFAIENYEANSASFVERAEKFRSDVKGHDKDFHKRAYIAMLFLAVKQELVGALAAYNVSLDDFVDLGRERVIKFFEDVPPLDVEIELVLERNEIWDKKIHKNDKTDIAFLTVAIPYCDVVVTEKFWRFSAHKRLLDKKYNTVLLDDLNELQELFSSL